MTFLPKNAISVNTDAKYAAGSSAQKPLEEVLKAAGGVSKIRAKVIQVSHSLL